MRPLVRNGHLGLSPFPSASGFRTCYHVFYLQLIQRALAARPIPGKRWGLWRLRHHTGGLTAPPHQLRRSCVAACVSPVVRRCPVRSLPPLDCGWLGWAGILDRIGWSRIHPTRLSNSPYAAAAVYTPPNEASGRLACTLYDFH